MICLWKCVEEQQWSLCNIVVSTPAVEWTEIRAHKCWMKENYVFVLVVEWIEIYVMCTHTKVPVVSTLAVEWTEIFRISVSFATRSICLHPRGGVDRNISIDSALIRSIVSTLVVEWIGIRSNVLINADLLVSTPVVEWIGIFDIGHDIIRREVPTFVVEWIEIP